MKLYFSLHRGIFMILSLLLCTSCESKLKVVEEKPPWFDYYEDFSKEKYYQFFQKKLFSSSSEQYPNITYLQDFYKKNEGVPLWTNEGFQENMISNLISYLKKSEEHGLSPNIFGYSELLHYREILKTHQVKNNEMLYQILTEMELSLSEAYIKYIVSLQYGVTSPVEVNGGKWLYHTLSPDSSFIAGILEATDSLHAFIKSIQPHHSQYLLLQKELSLYHALLDSDFVRIPLMKVDSGEINPAFRLVGKRLLLTHEIFPSYIPNDTLNIDLMNAVNQFRSRHAIPISNQLDEETIMALNLDFQYYIDKLAVNMERLLLKVIPKKEDHYIEINVADFMLHIYIQDTCRLQTKVCCGKSKIPEKEKDVFLAYKMETPFLYGEINQLVLNPEWNIPYSIIKEEYYDKLKKDPMKVINKEHLYVVNAKTKQYVEPDTISWNQIKPNNIPYRLIQSSGSYNALGKIKFNFPNAESVYLHDTNNKGAFTRRNRAISHGCVRVQNPYDLALIILQFNGYNEEELEKVNILLGQAPITEMGEEYQLKKQEQEQSYYNHLKESDKKFYRKM
ncbi:MAG: L,D-transpeptidase family protein, partial [Bacteroidales bacterium]